MEMVDKQRQNQIIYELSKNSAYFKRAAKLDAETDRKVESMRRMLTELRNGDGSLEARLRSEVEAKVVDLEHRRSFDRICCVLDMDMFYAAVEIRDQPSLADQPVAVGSLEMISTSNYVARKYGVRSAMPGFIAKKLCPQLVFVPCNFDKYRVVAEQIRSVIGEYDPSFSSYSLDEVYFDLTEAARERVNRGGHNIEKVSPDRAPAAECDGMVVLAPSEAQGKPHPLPLHDICELRQVACGILEEIRDRISTLTGGLTASAGIANNFFLAKICADFNKPNGQYELPPTRHAVMEFLSGLPTRKVGGIGKVTERMLKTLLDIGTMGQVRACLPQLLHCFTPQLGQFLLRTSYGVSSEEVAGVGAASEALSRRKSLGCERTYSSRGLTDRTEVLDRLKELSEQVSIDLQHEDLWAQGVTLKVKTVDFELLTRSITHKSFFQSSAVIMQLVTTLVSPMLPFKTGVRLLGVQVTRFRWPDDEDRGHLTHTNSQRKIDVFMSSTAKRGSTDRRDTDDDRRRLVDDDDGGRRQYCCKGEGGGDETQQQSVDEFLLDSDDTAEDLRDGTGSKGDGGRLQCPVCSVVQCDTLQQLNQHLDRCLADDSRGNSSHSSSSSSSTVVSRGGMASIGRTVPHTIDSFLTTISSSELIAMSSSCEGVMVTTGRVQKRKQPMIAISDYFMR
jgi:DNA polymerase kappa